MRIVEARSETEIAAVRELFEEYWRSFGFTPCFQGFAEEVATCRHRTRLWACCWWRKRLRAASRCEGLMTRERSSSAFTCGRNIAGSVWDMY